MEAPTLDPIEQLRAENQRLRAHIAVLETRSAPDALSIPRGSADPLLWFDAVSDAIFVADATWSIQHWNHAAAQLYGWAPAEAVGRPISELLGVARYLDSDSGDSAMQSLLSTGSWRGTVVQRTRDGGEVVVEGASRTLTDAQGRLTGYIGINRDVTARVRAEQALQHALGRLQILAAASNAFAEAAMDEPALLARVARLTAEPLVSSCIIWRSSADSRWLQMGAIYDHNPAVQELLSTVYAETLLPIDAPHPAAVVARSGQPLRIPVIDPAAMRPALSPEQWSAFERVRPHSTIIVPLGAHGATLGCLVFTRHEERQPAFTEDDLTLAQDLADRAALALTNTRLYQQAQAAQQSAAEALARLDALVTSLPSGIGYLDRELRYQLVNPALAALTGTTPEEHLGRTIHEIIPRLAPQLEPMLRQVLETGEAVRELELQSQGPSRDGELHDWLISTFPVHGPADVVIGVGVTVTDVTARKRTAAALRDTERKLGALFELLPVGISILDASRTLVYVNPAAEQIMRMDRAGLLTGAHRAYQYLRADGTPLPPEEHAVVRAFLERQAVTNMELGFRTEDGELVWTSINAVPVDFPDWRVVVVTTDITARKQAEEALRGSEARYRTLFETMAQGVIIYDTSGRDIMVNPAAERILGRPHADLSGGFATHPDWSIVYEDGTPLTPEEHPVRIALRNEREVRDLVLGVMPPEGRATRWLRAQVVPQRHAGATTVEQVYAIFEDITEQRVVQRALEEERQLLAAILHTMHEGVIAIRPGGALALINPAALALADLDPAHPPATLEEFAQQTSQRAFDGAGQALAPDAWPMLRALRGEHVIGLELNLRSTRGAPERWQAFNGTPVYDEHGTLILAILTGQDITQRKRDETQLRQQAAMLDHAHVIIRDAQSRIVLWNQGAEHLYGWTAEEATGRISHELLQTGFPISLAATEAQLFAEGRWEGELVHHRRDGSDIVVASLQMLFRDAAGTPTHILEVNNDVTALKRAEVALQAAYTQMEEQAAQLTSLIAHAPVGISLLDPELRFQHINAPLAAMNGLSPEAHLGRTLQEVLPALAPVLEGVYRQVIATSTPILDVEIAGETPAMPGVPRLWQASYFPVRKADGPLLGVGVIAVEITARRQAEQARDEAHQQLETVVEFLDEGVVAMRPDGALVVMNRTARELMLADPTARPRTVRELSAMNLMTLSDAAGQTLAGDNLPFLRVLRGESFRNWELKLHPARSAEERWVLISGTTTPAADGQPALSIVTRTDITERKRAELAVVAHLETLSRTNAELTRALKLKDEFLAMMSHELRTPLNVILGYSEGLEEEVYGPLVERQRTALAYVTTSGRHLLGILSDILDLAHLEGGRTVLTTELIAVDHLCRAATQLVYAAAQKKGIQLSRTVAVGVEALRADERRLTQILTNLLDNAIKFTPAGGRVGLEVTADAMREQIAFTVWDTGIGIAEEDYPRLFQPFTQLDGRLARSYEGIGLGLSLVRRLVDIHGGSVTLESTPGQGSRFTVSLPWAEADNVTPPTARAPLPAPHSWASPPRLVIADDHELTLQFYAELLGEQGCQVTLARTGVEAVTQVRATRPDVAVLDIQMPELDGLSAIRQIRADPEVATTPIIALTALAMPGDRERCLEAGAARYLAKPVSVRTLIATIGEALAAQGG